MPFPLGDSSVTVPGESAR